MLFRKKSTIVWNEHWHCTPQPLLPFSPWTSDPSERYSPLFRLHSTCLTSTFLAISLHSVSPALLPPLLQDLAPEKPNWLWISYYWNFEHHWENETTVKTYATTQVLCTQPKLSKHFYVLGHRHSYSHSRAVKTGLFFLSFLTQAPPRSTRALISL